MDYYGSKGTYSIDGAPLSIGTAENIFAIKNTAYLVAKMYEREFIEAHNDFEAKIIYMVENPPMQSTTTQIVWPTDVIRDSNGRFVGFTMPKFQADTTLASVYPYQSEKSSKITIEQKIFFAISLCEFTSKLHKAGYFVGDFNPKNIGINLQTGNIAFLDIGAFHFTDGNNHTYRCIKASNEYLAPELSKHCRNEYADLSTASLPTFGQETDNFALAIHIFRLLMNGNSPFNDIQKNENILSYTLEESSAAFEQDSYCFKPGNEPHSPTVPNMSAMSPDIQYLFKRTFIGGTQNPSDRVNADDWFSALVEYKDSLKHCARNSAHSYYANCTSCPYCEADKKYQESIAEAKYNSRTSSSNRDDQYFRESSTNNTGNYQQPNFLPQKRLLEQKKVKLNLFWVLSRIVLWIVFFPFMLGRLLWTKESMATVLKVFLTFFVIDAGIGYYFCGAISVFFLMSTVNNYGGWEAVIRMLLERIF